MNAALLGAAIVMRESHDVRVERGKVNLETLGSAEAATETDDGGKLRAMSSCARGPHAYSHCIDCTVEPTGNSRNRDAPLLKTCAKRWVSARSHWLRQLRPVSSPAGCLFTVG